MSSTAIQSRSCLTELRRFSRGSRLFEHDDTARRRRSIYTGFHGGAGRERRAIPHELCLAHADARPTALMILEAMKMEHTIVSPRDGVIERVAFRENELVPADAVLVAFKE